MIKSLIRLLIFTMLAGTVLAGDAKILEIENVVQTFAAGAGAWAGAAVDQVLSVKDRIRTRQRSRAAVQLTDLYTMRLEQFTTIEVTAALTGDKPRLDLQGGAAFIFSREKSGEIDIQTPAANGALRGTQLFARVFPGGRSFYQVLEGTVELQNPHGRLTLNAGEAGEATPGTAPRKTAVIQAKNLLQWALYYPAVLDPDEFALDGPVRPDLQRSLDSYRRGDLLTALAVYPDDSPRTVPTRLYRAGVLLAVGRVDEAGAVLRGVPATHAGRRALERLIAAVQFREQPPWPLEGIATASEAMAESYYRQSRAMLEEARLAARRATELAPANGFAWTRLAELEFSFGRGSAAKKALENALRLTPDHAQAHALNGFVLSGQNRLTAARESFEQAIRLDGALGNGWMGRGLVKIKRGDRPGGRADLQTAATVEPLQSIFHSYLGKALSVEGREDEARRDLDLARSLDPADPTPWLYSALGNQQENRTNEAVDDLLQSIRLNDNRRVYRSRFLLDQDRAVRSANLAKIYQNAGMTEAAVREASRAVENDYTSASAHLFLANSFDALRDPRRIELRYETPWFNELLLANLLSPVGGGPLSQFVSQQEYSKLLEADGLGSSATHEWRSTEETHATEIRSTASIFGTFRNVSFGLDAYYLDDDGGIRPNAANWRQEVYGQLKWQATPDDTLYFLGKWQDQKAGDNFETFDDQPLAPGVQFREKQEPGLLLGGWNHRWAPGIHTVILGGRLGATQRLSDPYSNQLLLGRDALAFNPGFLQLTPEGFEQYTDPRLQAAVLREAENLALGGLPGQYAPASLDMTDFQTVRYSRALARALAPYLGSGEILSAGNQAFTFDTLRKFEIYTAEVQQIVESEHNTLLAGGRWQGGQFETFANLSVIRPTFAGGFTTPAVEQHSVVDFERMTAYAYDYLKPTRWLTLIGGVSWDHIDHPENFRNPPVSDLQRSDERVSGKFGITLAPSPWINVRGAYTEGMGGVTFDESVRLEPVQVAGFNQSWRTILSESIAGSVETPLYRSWGLGVDGRLPSRTWWSATASIIDEDVDRTLGSFDGYDLTVLPISPAYFPGSTRQELDYREESLGASLHQLISDEFSLGADYRVSHSKLRSQFPDIPTLILPGADLTDEATLHQLSLSANWNSPSGLFARVEANWYSQELLDDPLRTPEGVTPREGDDFWQYNAMVGYRFRRNQCEISAGVANIGNKNYRLSPLNSHPEIEHGETVVLRCRLTF